jgi:cytochrome c-type biogenesis protein CcmH/NrfG
MPGVPIEGPLRVLLALVCLAGAACCVIAYRSERRQADAAEAAFFEQRAPEVRALWDDARTLNPDSEIDVGEALTRPPREAERMIGKALRREPENARLWLMMTRFRTEGGRPAAARRSYRRALELDPYLPR